MVWMLIADFLEAEHVLCVIYTCLRKIRKSEK